VSLHEELAIADELDRRRAQRSFLAFYMRMTGFLPPRHVEVIARAFQLMEEDQIDRLMLFAPPRHAKSLLGTTLFPAWIMGRHPTAKLMSVVHTQAYARKIGRNVRNLLRHPRWPFDGGLVPGEPEPDDEDDNEEAEPLFEDAVELAPDSKAKEQWATTAGGEYNGFGIIGGNQHGNPAEWLFMDDIVKGRKVALSAHMREEVWETYKTDLLSRLQGRAKQVMVITRWHQDDPPGRILPEGYDGRSGWFRDRETGDLWYVLSLPALSEHLNDPAGRAPGEWLWPENFGEKSILPSIRKRGGWIWSGLYQQRPSPEEGLMFGPHMIGRFAPSRLDVTSLRIYGSSDYAVTEAGTTSDNPDWTVHGVWGVDPDRNVYLLDGWRGRTTPDIWAREWARLVLKHKPLLWFEEQGQILKAVGPILRSLQEDERAYTARKALTSSTDKVSRAQALLGIASLGKMHLPNLAELPPGPFHDLVEAFARELVEFPGGTKDDTVDMASLFARGWTIPGQARGKPRSPHGDTLEDLFLRHERKE
jgi:predicted phage terminase large subunit-like protein